MKSDHHFVPRFYLRRWEDSGGRLWAFRRENGRAMPPKQYPVAQILYERDLYTVRGLDEDDVYFGEDEVFQEIDNAAAPVLASILDGEQKISAPNLDSFWRFMYTLQVRNPRTIRALASAYPQMEREILEELIQKHGPPIPGRPAPSELLRDSLNAGKFLATKIAKDDERYRSYFNLPSAIVPFESPINLFTSDYPFLAFPDIDSPDAFFVFPIAPTHCFLSFARPEMEVLFLGRISRARLADLVNLLVVSQAEYVYTRELSNEARIYELLGCWSSDKDLFRAVWDAALRKAEPVFAQS